MKPTLFSSAKFANLLVILITITSCLRLALHAQTFGEAAFNFLDDYPQEATDLGWNEEAQGLAHDQDHWFITQQGAIWKIPVTHSLWANPTGVSGVKQKLLSTITQLHGYNYFGDPEYFEYPGQGYLFVPVTGNDIKPAIAVFRGDSLDYVTHRVLPDGANGSWCAVDNLGNLAIPNYGDPFVLSLYSFDYNELRDFSMLELDVVRSIALLDEEGTPARVGDRMQGGVISPSVNLLFVSAGKEEGDILPIHGIHVFNLATGRRVTRSSLSSRPFMFEFDHESIFGQETIGQEPEGMTFWDLDDRRAPGIRGQLHVIMLDNDLGPDDVYVKHYTSGVYVDLHWHSPEHGIPANPFNTVAEGNNYAWDGADIRIKTGSYPEALTFSETMRIIADDGPVTIGR